MFPDFFPVTMPINILYRTMRVLPVAIALCLMLFPTRQRALVSYLLYFDTLFMRNAAFGSFAFLAQLAFFMGFMVVNELLRFIICSYLMHLQQILDP